MLNIKGLSVTRRGLILSKCAICANRKTSKIAALDQSHVRTKSAEK